MRRRENFLSEILDFHPLTGIERDEPFHGDTPGLQPPSWIDLGPVYEIFLRVFSADGTFRSLRSRLPYLKELGTKTLWLMPLHPTGMTGRKGQYGSPYAIQNYKQIDPFYGTEKDFRDLIAAVHDYDMRIILDAVMNHAAIDSRPFRENPRLIRPRRSDLAQGWTDINEFDYDYPQTSARMLDVLEYWAREYQIDGYRCDVAGLVPDVFWRTAAERLLNINDEFFMLAEWEGARLHVSGFHATYDWSMYSLFQNVRDGLKGPADIVYWCEEKRKNYPLHSLPLRFTENHDLARTVRQFGRDSFYPFTAVLFTLYGIPLLYAGQEIGAAHKPSLFERELISWDEKNDECYRFYRRLINLRNRIPELRSREIRSIHKSCPEELLVFDKGSAGGSVRVIINFSGKEFKFYEVVDFKKVHYMDLMSEPPQSINGTMSIRGYGVHILRQIYHESEEGIV